MIKLAGYFTGFSSKSDGSASLRFNTQEIAPDEFSEFKRNLNSFGWILFKENAIDTKDIPKENAVEDGLTKSERLRNVLFVWWKELVREAKTDLDFETFRNKQMENFIDAVKQKLE